MYDSFRIPPGSVAPAFTDALVSKEGWTPLTPSRVKTTATRGYMVLPILLLIGSRGTYRQTIRSTERPHSGNVL